MIAEEIKSFTYEEAFERNLGWLTREEQNSLRRSCVAIAGLGGAGGYQTEALARLGVGHFKIADHDVYEFSNLNRQAGATMETIGCHKVEVMRDRILSINPEARIEIFSDGITEENVGTFMEGADIVVDGIEFFEYEAKLLLFQMARKVQIPAVTCCPLGFGASAIIFSPGSMSYEDYFDFRKGMSEREKQAKMSFGLSPSPFCFKYMNKRALSFDQKRAASVAPGLMLVGALTASEAVKILTGKEKVYCAPCVYQIDLLTYRVRHKYYRWGMKSLWMRFKRLLVIDFGLGIMKTFLARQKAHSPKFLPATDH